MSNKKQGANPQNKNHQVLSVSNTVLIADEINPIIDADAVQAAELRRYALHQREALRRQDPIVEVN